MNVSEVNNMSNNLIHFTSYASSLYTIYRPYSCVVYNIIINSKNSERFHRIATIIGSCPHNYLFYILIDIRVEQ